MTSEHQAVKEFVIPRKGGSTHQAGESSRPLLEDIPLESEDFRTVYWPVLCKNLSPCQKDRNVKVIHCAAVKNRTLEEKFKSFQKKLEDQGDPFEVSYCFCRLVGPPRETELIAQYGLFTGNSFVGDLGDASKGVHLNESPDLVTPAKFLEKTRLQIMAFKVLKGRTNLVGLSSFTMEPTAGCASHIAKPPTSAESLSRHELFRYNQIYLYEEKESGTYASVPANVLPFAVFAVEFPPNATTSFKYMPFTVWNGAMKIGERRYGDLMLQSNGGVFIRPPFFGRIFEITDLVPWKACLDYPPIIDLLSHQTIGKLSTKKEVLLPGVKRLATYFTLKSQYDNPHLSSFHESMRVRCIAGISVLASGATVLVIPNGEFSSLLALPCKEGVVFHCLHFSKTLTDSLLTGTFEPLSIEENDEFNRLPNVGERVDGQDVDVQSIIEQLACGCVQRVLNDENARNSPANNPLLKQAPRHPDATPENLSPADMDIVTESDEEEATISPRLGEGLIKKSEFSPKVSPRESKQNERPVATSTNLTHTFDEAVSEVCTALKTVKAKTRVEAYRSSRDPRQRPRTGATALPLPRVGVLPMPNLTKTPSTSKLSNAATEQQASSDMGQEPQSEEVEDRCYSPSQAISDETLSAGPSSPNEVPSPDQSPPNSESGAKQTQSAAIPIVTLDEEGEVLSIMNDSPASPPPEKNVYVARAPKIISGCDLRPLCEQQPLHTTSNTYQAPEISLFANLRGSAINNFHLSSAGLQKLNEMGVRWGTTTSFTNKTTTGSTNDDDNKSLAQTTSERSGDVVASVAPVASERTNEADADETRSNGNKATDAKTETYRSEQPVQNKSGWIFDGPSGSLFVHVPAERFWPKGAATVFLSEPYEHQMGRRSRWSTNESVKSGSADIDYRTILPQLATTSSTNLQQHRGPESAATGNVIVGIDASTKDRDDRAILSVVGGLTSCIMQPTSDLNPPRLLEAVPSPVSSNLSSSQQIQGLGSLGAIPSPVMANSGEAGCGLGDHSLRQAPLPMSSGSNEITRRLDDGRSLRPVPPPAITGSSEAARRLGGRLFGSATPPLSPNLGSSEAARRPGGSLLRSVPSPAISNELDRGSGGHFGPAGLTRGGLASKPIPLNAIRPKQPGLLGERPRPPCFPSAMPMPISAGSVRPPLAAPSPCTDTTRPPLANFAQRPPFERIAPHGYGFFNRPTPATTSHCASSPSCSSKPDSVVSVDFPYGTRPNAIVVPDGKLFVQALMHPGRLRSLLERFLIWRQKWNVIWRLDVHSHIFRVLSENKDGNDVESSISKRHMRYNHLLSDFVTRGCIELLEAHECDAAPNAVTQCDYLKCLSKTAKDIGPDTSVIFLSSADPDAEMSQMYGNIGVEVCSFQQLMEKCGL